MKRVDYCLYIKARNGNGYEVAKYFKIGELIDLNIEKFKRACLSAVEIRKALSCELIWSNDHLHFDCFELYPVDCLFGESVFFRDEKLQQTIEVIRNKYNSFVPFSELDNIPKRALLIGDEVIPMPPIPDKYLEVYIGCIDRTCIKKSFDKTKRYCSNDSIGIVRYAELTTNQRIVYSEYDEYPDDYSRQDNNDYLWDLARNIEILARNDFENELNTSVSQETASAPNASCLPSVPATVVSVEQSIGQNENYPSTWIFAKGDEAATSFDDNGAAGMVVAANTARIANNTDLLSDIAETLHRMAEFQRENVCTASEPVTNVPVAADDSPDVLSVPEYDNPNEWISIADLACKMVAKGLSIDTNAAKDNLRNMKSKGWKSEEKYDGEHSLYGVSIHGKWRMVQQGVKWSTYFYCPSLKMKTNPEK